MGLGRKQDKGERRQGEMGGGGKMEEDGIRESGEGEGEGRIS